MKFEECAVGCRYADGRSVEIGDKVLLSSDYRVGVRTVEGFVVDAMGVRVRLDIYEMVAYPESLELVSEQTEAVLAALREGVADVLGSYCRGDFCAVSTDLASIGAQVFEWATGKRHEVKGDRGYGSLLQFLDSFEADCGGGA